MSLTDSFYWLHSHFIIFRSLRNNQIENPVKSSRIHWILRQDSHIKSKLTIHPHKAPKILKNSIKKLGKLQFFCNSCPDTLSFCRFVSMSHYFYYFPIPSKNLFNYNEWKRFSWDIDIKEFFFYFDRVKCNTFHGGITRPSN
jgi:hypothetical protein